MVRGPVGPASGIDILVSFDGAAISGAHPKRRSTDSISEVTERYFIRPVGYSWLRLKHGNALGRYPPSAIARADSGEYFT